MADTDNTDSRMNRIQFPNPRNSTPEGLVAMGGNLEIETLEAAYRSGLFPWPQEDLPLLWFSPDPRGILDFADLHIPDSLKKWARKHKDWEFTINRAFKDVISQCRIQKRPGQEGTWILPEMVEAYVRLFDAGRILSLECWSHGNLIGGIYGVMTLTAKGEMLFSGESMFHAVDNASKMCLWKLVEHLQKQGHRWIDIQMITDVTKLMGGKYISREEFLGRIGV